MAPAPATSLAPVATSHAPACMAPSSSPGRLVLVRSRPDLSPATADGATKCDLPFPKPPASSRR